MSPGPRPTSVPSGILIHPALWPQYIGRKVGGAAVPPFLGELSPHLTQCGRGRASMPSFILIYPNVRPQYTTNVSDRQTDRSDNGPIAQQTVFFANDRPKTGQLNILTGISLNKFDQLCKNVIDHY